MDFSLRQIRHFIALAETGQVSKAALRCNISQSSMTISLRALEEAVGVGLFVRHAKGLRLTDQGERFLRHAQQVDALVQRAIDDMQVKPASIATTLRLGVTDTISAYLMPALRVALKRRFPDLRLVLLERERPEVEQMLVDGDLDLGLVLVPSTPTRPDIHAEVMLRSSRHLWAAPDHPLATANSVALADIAQEDFLLLDMDEHVQTAKVYWQEHRMQPSIAFQSKSIETIRSMVAFGSGVTILSDLVYRPWSLEGGRIIRRPLLDRVPTMDIVVIHATHHALSPAAEQLRDFLRLELRDMQKKAL